MELKEMLLELDRLNELVNKGLIREETYDIIEENTINEIINKYSAKEIEKAQKELGISYEN